MEVLTVVRFSLFLHFATISFWFSEGVTRTTFRAAQQAQSYSAATSDGLKFKHKEILEDGNGSILEWDLEESTITFTFSTFIGDLEEKENLTILLGLSKTGQVDGSDVVALKVNTVDGEHPELVDMHGIGNEMIVADTIQNWRLDSSHLVSSRFTMTVSRHVNTCDMEDLHITNDLVRVIWGYGEARSNKQITSLNFQPQGNISVFLLDPTVEIPSSVPGNQVQSWRVSRSFPLPAQKTTYWCTIHRGLKLTHKHHIVGYGAYFKDEVSRLHVHHMIVHRCIPRVGVDASEMYERFVGHPGEECYLEEEHVLPTFYCTELIVPWGVGGKTFYLPENLGIAIGDNRNEYFMLETHYSNPDSISGLVIDHGMDMEYTPEVRAKEGNIMFVGNGQFGLFQLPPHTKQFTVAGHCSAGCIRSMIPKAGINIVGGMLHSHTAGRKINLKHFRGDKELPWVLSNLNYDFNYQQFRLTQKPVKILQGDQLTVQCEMDTSGRNGTTLAGFSTEEEMCVSFIIVDKRIPNTYCTSEYPGDKLLRRYGISSAIWNRGRKERMVSGGVDRRLIGRRVDHVIDDLEGEWSESRIRELEKEQLYSWHDATCPNMLDLLGLAHGLDLIDTVSRGFLPASEFVKRFRITTKTLSTPLFPGLRSVKYFRTSETYTPENVCVA